MGLASSTIANIGFGAQAAGIGSSVAGSYYAARGQRTALLAQAQADLNSARSDALAATGAAALDAVNIEAEHNASLTALEFSRLSAQQQAADMRTSAQVSAIQASVSVAGAEIGAQIDENNAALLELRAQAALRRGEQDEQASRMKFAQAKSTATARLARGNVDLSEGAPLMVRAGYDVASDNTAIQIQQAVLMEAYGMRVSAENERMSAQAKRASAAATMSAASLAAGLAEANARFTVGMAEANARAGAALAAAGMLNAQAASRYRADMAAVQLRLAESGAATRRAQAGAISPGLSAFTSLLGGATQFASSWYQYNRSR